MGLLGLHNLVMFSHECTEIAQAVVAHETDQPVQSSGAGHNYIGHNCIGLSSRQVAPIRHLCYYLFIRLLIYL